MPQDHHYGTHHLEWQCHMVWVQQYRSKGKGRGKRVKWTRVHKWRYLRVKNDI